MIEVNFSCLVLKMCCVTAKLFLNICICWQCYSSGHWSHSGHDYQLTDITQLCVPRPGSRVSECQVPGPLPTLLRGNMTGADLSDGNWSSCGSGRHLVTGHPSYVRQSAGWLNYWHKWCSLTVHSPGSTDHCLSDWRPKYF